MDAVEVFENGISCQSCFLTGTHIYDYKQWKKKKKPQITCTVEIHKRTEIAMQRRKVENNLEGN
jgi:hypothetical protein